jgi:hypothetical protein
MQKEAAWRRPFDIIRLLAACPKNLLGLRIAL